MKITPEHIEAAWEAFRDCPVDMCGDHDEEQKKCVVAALSAAIAAQEQVPVQAKALEWDPYRAETPFGYYLVYDQRDVPAYEMKGRLPFLLVGSRLDYSRHATLKEARAAAQAHFNNAIRSALVASTHPSPVSSETVEDEPTAWSYELRRQADIGKHYYWTKELSFKKPKDNERQRNLAPLYGSAQPLPAQEAVDKPFMYGIMEPDGTAYMDEICVDLSPGTLEELIEEQGLEGHTVVALYAHPAPSTAGMVGETPAPSAQPMGVREAVRQEAIALIHRAGLEMEEEYDLLVDDLIETMMRFAVTPRPVVRGPEDDGPLTISYPVHKIAHNLLLAHTGSEGGCPKIDWYKLRSEIADAIAVALDNQRRLDTPAPRPGLVSVPRDRLLKLMEYSDAEYVPNSIFDEFRGYLNQASPPSERVLGTAETGDAQ